MRSKYYDSDKDYQTQIQALKSGRTVNVKLLRQKLEEKIRGAKIEQDDVVAAFYLVKLFGTREDDALHKRAQRVHTTRNMKFEDLEKQALRQNEQQKQTKSAPQFGSLVEVIGSQATFASNDPEPELERMSQTSTEETIQVEQHQEGN